jgi:hypothetical protein
VHVRERETDRFKGIGYPGLRYCLRVVPGATARGRLGSQGWLSTGAGALGKVPLRSRMVWRRSSVESRVPTESAIGTR